MDRNFEASFADKLACPTMQMGGALKKAGRYLSESGGFLNYLPASEPDFRAVYRFAKSAGLDCELSGAAACVVASESFRKANDVRISANSRVLVVCTGNGDKYMATL